MLTALTLATLTHIAIVDSRTRTIENAAALLLFAVALVVSPHFWMWGLLGFGLFAVPSLAKLVGFGDAKLMLGIGTLLGPTMLIVLLTTFGAQYVFQRVMASRGNTDDRYPLAPALCASTALLGVVL